jgi:hypothetical protein
MACSFSKSVLNHNHNRDLCKGFEQETTETHMAASAVAKAMADQKAAKRILTGLTPFDPQDS